ncbi:PadR family transcriptional regulator [Microvirga sp. 2MCAF38]|uniref:PadR family transcriptional regulator n=1 Tax=Microvirga sp. 2MCAF38 TaxID=3232989 RepID=UPI003F99F893
MRHTQENHDPRRWGACRHEFGSRGFAHRGGGHRGFGYDWNEERGEGRGGRRRVFDSGELRLVLLKLIEDQPRHGYDLIRAIEELTGGTYVPSAGVIYPALSMLQDLGHIEEAGSEGGRKAFAITAEGAADLATNAEKVKALFARLAELAAKHARTDSAPIRRAMENLRTVLRHRFSSEDLGKSTIHDVAAILDEAAQRIERL